MVNKYKVFETKDTPEKIMVTDILNNNITTFEDKDYIFTGQVQFNKGKLLPQGFGRIESKNLFFEGVFVQGVP